MNVLLILGGVLALLIWMGVCIHHIIEQWRK
jgi:hypothetical protein